MNKKIKIVCAVIAILCVAFGISWKASEGIRYRNEKISQIEEEIEECRKTSESLSVYIPSSLIQDEKFQTFLISQVDEMCKNNDTWLLLDLIMEMDEKECNIPTVKETINEYFSSFTDIEIALETNDKINYCNYYSGWVLNRSSKVIDTYIEKNKTNPITMTKGEGFYAEEENSSSSHTVGLPSSPLYDRNSVSYYGDFKVRISSGVRLNSYYQEEKYHRESWSFRDNIIDFSPDDGECVWSGDYLFCFSDSGILIGYEELSSNN